MQTTNEFFEDERSMSLEEFLEKKMSAFGSKVFSPEEMELYKIRQNARLVDKMVRNSQEASLGKKHAGVTMAKVKLNVENRSELMEKVFHFLRKKQRGFLVICSVPGIGKTTMLAGILDEQIRRGEDVYAIKERVFFEKLRKVMEMDQEYHQEIKNLCDHNLMLFDDFGRTDNLTPWRQEVLFSLIDERYESGKPTIITSNLFPEQFSQYVGSAGYDRLTDESNSDIIEIREGRSWRKEKSVMNFNT